MTILYKDPAKVSGGAARLLRYLGMPIFLGFACLALYLYIGSKDLDSIERRSINANVITARLIEHIQLAAVSTVIVVVLAVGVGILLTRPFARRVTTPIVGIANIGQAIPSIGLLAILAVVWAGGFWPAVVALVAYSFLSILRNTMVGLQQVDSSTIEAARGMGMTKTAVLFRIEMPLAVPIILAGIRTALIINVGTATLTTFTGAGTLGELINNALRLGREDTVLVVGSGLTAILALFIDWLASVAEDVLRPKGL
ncbi:MAG: ABC transporter permease [Rubrobacter sp.]|jgi:osmoprotectant transport system permease protein|nr:ABC transporter permease [Rubrobacter sp.]